MPFSLDPEVGAGLKALYEGAGEAPLPPVGDVESRRQGVEALQRAIHAQLPTPTPPFPHQYRGTADLAAVPHAFEALVPRAAVSQWSADNRRRVLLTL